MARTIRLERAIYRIDDEPHQVHGWLVKMTTGSQAHRKFFSDATWNGREKSLAVARAYRERTLAAQPKNTAADLRRLSAFAGLECYCTEDTHHLNKALQHWFWRATWKTPQGKTRRAAFSVGEHGDERAFKMALQARRAGIGGKHGLPCGTPACLHHMQGETGCARTCTRRPRAPGEHAGAALA